MNKILFFLCITVLFFCSSCDDNECKYDEDAVISGVRAPETANTGSKVAVEVDYLLSNGCGSFLAFSETEDGDTTNIRVLSRYAGCACTLALTTETRSYLFQRSVPGHYTLIFTSGDGETITKKITLN